MTGQGMGQLKTGPFSTAKKSAVGRPGALQQRFGDVLGARQAQALRRRAGERNPQPLQQARHHCLVAGLIRGAFEQIEDNVGLFLFKRSRHSRRIVTGRQPAYVEAGCRQSLLDLIDGEEDLLLGFGIGMTQGQDRFVVKDEDASRFHRKRIHGGSEKVRASTGE